MKKKATILPVERKIKVQPRDFVIRQILDYSKATQVLEVKNKVLVFSLN